MQRGTPAGAYTPAIFSSTYALFSGIGGALRGFLGGDGGC